MYLFSLGSIRVACRVFRVALNGSKISITYKPCPPQVFKDVRLCGAQTFSEGIVLREFYRRLCQQVDDCKTLSAFIYIFGLINVVLLIEELRDYLGFDGEYRFCAGFGPCMNPLFWEYFTLLLAKRVLDAGGEVEPGDLVLFTLYDEETKKYKRLGKRVHEITTDGVFVLGDNSRESNDSRYFGAVPFANVTHKVVCLLVPFRLDLSKRKPEFWLPCIYQKMLKKQV
ncbi:hypothetical protein L596_006565 [Steinernema carpocapsae]|uniref:Peptidase S26 domain-containing protein n=1 Tax=Steinernema carpocapsae TaxID=34508 RepID=A0A4U8V2F3_STECR|nr:hypothetical protein L596_006565 [Steinernema carpocapsae]